jgi:hypothetical protein
MPEPDEPLEGDGEIFDYLAVGDAEDWAKLGLADPTLPEGVIE